MGKTPRVVVIGGGITGRLVGFRMPGATILDWGSPPRHDRLTRDFGTNYLWEPLEGLPCRQFPVVTCVDGLVPTPERILAYKKKVGKEGDGGDWGRQFEHEMDGWDLMELPNVPILYQRRIVEICTDHHFVVDSIGQIHGYDVLVSTIPLYALLEMMKSQLTGAGFTPDEQKAAFPMDPVYVKIGARPPDAPYPPEVLYVNYLTYPDVPVYRICDRGDERHWEGLTDMGLTPTKRLVPGKIRPSATARLWVAFFESFNIKCFGRYATWRPDELVHETDMEIRRWINSL